MLLPEEEEEPHRRNHTSPALCYKCGRFKAKIRTHLEICGTQILCVYCGDLYTDQRTYITHLRCHLRKCPYCSKSFPDEAALERHQTVHSKKCGVCEKEFETAVDLIIHKEEHYVTSSYACTQCDFVTKLPDLIKTHWEEQHKVGKVHKCTFCEKIFTNKNWLTHHMELHKGTQNHKCEICGKRFGTMRYLMNHKRYNHEDQSFECKECGRSFKFKGSLRRHRNIFHNVGPTKTVSCPVCFKKIANNYGLSVHMKVHTGEKTIICETCGRGYHVYKSYKKHVSIHHPGQVPIPPVRKSKYLLKDNVSKDMSS